MKLFVVCCAFVNHLKSTALPVLTLFANKLAAVLDSDLSGFWVVVPM